MDIHTPPESSSSISRSSSPESIEPDWSEKLVHQYADEHELQNLVVYFPHSQSESENDSEQDSGDSKFWIIYIHGGAWRDPRITSTSVEPTVTQLFTEPTYHSFFASRIAAVASINYRLSPHPSFPQDKDSTPKRALRVAKHPDHLLDVKKAIRYLQQQYGFKERYILAGHSCGATLALQTVMGPDVLENEASANTNQIDIVLPMAIAGVCGIYDLRALRDTHASVKEYGEFIAAAFGENEALWDNVSPAKWLRFSETWSNGFSLVLAHSQEDELVEENQALAMNDLMSRSWVDGRRDSLYDPTLKGKHDEVWEKGKEMARIIELSLSAIVKNPHVG